jgi:dTDP-4-amino-4,6-dideoxy-D-galactose acyltransferase
MSEGTSANKPCEFLEWDSRFFGRRIARSRGTRFSPDDIDEVIEWCRDGGIECLYLLAASDDAVAIPVVVERGFHLVDIRMTFQVTFEEIATPPAAGVRPALPGDIERLMQTARSSFRDSRFHYDPNFAKSRCDEMYATWIEKSCQGHADFVLVAENAGEPAGFVTGHAGPDGTGSIGLLAVDSAHRGLELGARLVTAALCAFGARGIQTITVVTQGRNLRAQRLYQKCGFVSRSVELWYHRWFT